MIRLPPPRIWFRLRWPKQREVQQEAVTLLVLAVLFLLFAVPALGYAAREGRDGERRERIRTLKTELERFNNEQQGFPLHPSGNAGVCGESSDPDDWFFTHFLSTRWLSPPVDPRHAAGKALRYCPTSVIERSGQSPRAAGGFYLEAELENLRPEEAGFNSEHNVFERTLTVGRVSVYRLCGGSETQCGTRLGQ